MDVAAGRPLRRPPARGVRLSDSNDRGPQPAGEARSFRNLLLYCLLLGGAGWALLTLWPMASAALHLDNLLAGANAQIEEALGQPLRPDDAFLSLSAAPLMVVAAMSMIGALLVMIPVAWSYVLVKGRVGYDQSVVHTLLILPVAVTGIVMIVQDSIALAFSLAGIVAAVRFRTTLDDTKDAVYVFLAIAVGLAAGIQALALAFVMSLVFIAINLALWRFGFGDIYVDQHGSLTLGDVLAGPGSADKAVKFGDARLLDALAVGEIKDVAAKVARMEQRLQAAGDNKKERKAYAVLMVHTDQVAEAQQAVEPVLQAMSLRWNLAEIVARDSGPSVIEYLVRPRDDVSESELMEAVRTAGADRVRAAEMRSLKAVAKRLDP